MVAALSPPPPQPNNRKRVNVIVMVIEKNVKTLIFCFIAYPPDENIRLALLNTQKIDYKIYLLNWENKKVEFLDAQDAFSFLKFEKLPLEEQKRQLKKESHNKPH